jgi:hypothetical protein
MGKRIKKAAVGRIDPNIPPDELAKIHAEIDAMKDEPVDPVGGVDRGDPEGQGMMEAQPNAA